MASPTSTDTSTSAATDAQLRELFLTASPAPLDAAVLAELRAIMQLHSLDAQELWYKWESYSLKMGGDELRLDGDAARRLREDVQGGLERENRSKAHAHALAGRAARGGGVGTPRGAAARGDVLGL
jgi:DNA polymerase alpha subunit B